MGREIVITEVVPDATVRKAEQGRDYCLGAWSAGY